MIRPAYVFMIVFFAAATLFVSFTFYNVRRMNEERIAAVKENNRLLQENNELLRRLTETLKKRAR